jgi:Family of unknown function (DUF6600)
MATVLHPSPCRRGIVRFAGTLLLAALVCGPGGALAEDACAAERSRATGAKRLDDLGDPLSNLGVWVEVPRYGRAWKPCDLPSGWRPYFHGSWTWTERGWFWVSQEPWGWLTYHYGRWLFDGAQGWVWVPGKVWAPAWVTWRWNDEVIGWAPLEPGGKGYSAFWTFVPAARLAGESVEAMAIPGPRVPALLLKTRLGAGQRRGHREGQDGWTAAVTRLSRR